MKKLKKLKVNMSIKKEDLEFEFTSNPKSLYFKEGLLS